jgi:hypothetical protein
MKILVLDPGNSTGWCMWEGDAELLHGTVVGGTWPEDHKVVWDFLELLEPDLVIYETFKLYPGLASKLAWNTFYPCEVIGIIKLYCLGKQRTLIAQQPSDKKYSGGLDDKCPKGTEHTKDAYLHLKFYARRNGVTW